MRQTKIDHRCILESFISNDFVLVPIPKKRKSPHLKNWHDKANCITTHDQLNKVFSKDGSILKNIGLVHKYSRTCAFDIDDLKRTATFMSDRGIDIDSWIKGRSAVGITSGTPNRAKLLFRFPNGKELLPTKQIKDGHTMVFELRCVTANGSSVQDVLPPSVHPTGRQYEWCGPRGSTNPADIPYIPKKLYDLWLELVNSRAKEESEPKKQLKHNVDVEHIESALFAIDPDINYDDWLRIGMALKNENVPRGMELWDEWSKEGQTYKSGECMKKWNGFAEDGPITLLTLFKLAITSGWKVPPGFNVKPKPFTKEQLDGFIEEAKSPEDLDDIYYAISASKDTLDAADVKECVWGIKDKFDLKIGVIRSKIDRCAIVPPALSEHELGIHALKHFEVRATNNMFYRVNPDTNIWSSISVDAFADMLHETFPRQPAIAKLSAGRSVATGAYTHATRTDPWTLEDAPIGLACNDGNFYTLDGCEALTPEHKQTFCLDYAPPKHKPKPMQLLKALRGAFKGQSNIDDHIALMQEVIGALLFRMMAPRHQVVLFYGVARSGKSMLANLIQALFPPGATSAVEPFLWTQMYHRAELAGSSFNFAAELDEDERINGKVFKSVVDGSAITARRIHEKPFMFKCTASHLFCSNYLPTSTDSSDAFFRRWVTIEFTNPVPEEDVVPDFHNFLLESEGDEIVGWAIEGARRLNENGVFTKPQKDNLDNEWKETVDPVYVFLSDEEWVQLDPSSKVQASILYEAFAKWAHTNGYYRDLPTSTAFGRRMNPKGRAHIARLGINRKKGSSWFYTGVRLLKGGPNATLEKVAKMEVPNDRKKANSRGAR